MGFSEAVQWWEDWQLRLLVLASLFLQCFLFVGALLRKRRISHLFRSLIWLAYQGSDAVVIYALATLFFNRHKEELAMHPSSGHLDTLWAPILLLHLGGQDGITAYSIEDNENWRRHLLISVSQITIAIYVFRKSWWSDDWRLQRAAILLFVPGVLKCLEKPWALKNATVTSIEDSSDSQLEATLKNDSTLQKGILSLDKYLQEAGRSFTSLARSSVAENLKDKLGDEPYHLFVDLGHPYFIRLKNLQLMAPLAGAKEEAHGLVRWSLSKAFDRLYTKHRGSFGGLLRAAVVLLPFADVGLFQDEESRRRNAYARADVVVTYVLLCCTAALELVSAWLVLRSGLPLLHDQISQYNLIGYMARDKNYQWFWSLASRLGCKDQLERLCCTAPPEPSLAITKLVYGHVARGWTEYISRPAWEIVTTDAGDDDYYSVYDTFVGQYRRFNNSRGLRTLKWETEKFGNSDALISAVAASTRMPFDESVLLWHLATEFCYFEHVDTGSDATRNSRVMSDYMAYLLFVKPEMLVPGARRSLFKATYRELEPSGCHVELEPETTLAPPPKTKDEMARKIIQKVKSTIGSDDLVHKAWELAHELMEFAKEAEKKEEEKRKEEEEEDMKLTEEQRREKKRKAEEEEKKRREEEAAAYMKLSEEQKKKKQEDEEKAKEVKKKAEEVRKKQLMIRDKKAGEDKMWTLIQGVWVEMLCFSAGRCRGHLHAKNLGKGGEYLSYVWLLLSYMGMETMPERAQRPELPVEGDMGALAKPLEEEIMKEPEKKEEKDKGKGKLSNKGEKAEKNNSTPINEHSEPAQPTAAPAINTSAAAGPTATTTATALTAGVAHIVVGDDNV